MARMDNGAQDCRESFQDNSLNIRMKFLGFTLKTCALQKTLGYIVHKLLCHLI